MAKSKKGFTLASQSLLVLCDVLKEQLYRTGSRPFERRTIAVPNLALKSFLTQRIAEGGVAAGLTVSLLSQAWEELSGKRLPSRLELSLFLQEALPGVIEVDAELSRYFGTEARESRIGPFADLLAAAFLRFGEYGTKGLSGWQKTLWEKVQKKWTFPIDRPPCRRNGQIHLLGFSHIPPSYEDFFEKAGAHFYFFSPCATYWGDQISGKQTQLDLFAEEEGESWHCRLLASLGKVGRKQAERFEEVENLYLNPKGEKALQKLQQSLLQAEMGEVQCDFSIRFFSCPSASREVEILRKNLLVLFAAGVEPKDVQVLTPHIDKFAPYIASHFEEIPHSISDLRLDHVDEVAAGFSKLMGLAKERFSKDALFALLRSPPFAERFKIEEDELRLWEKWARGAHIDWGSSQEERTVHLRGELVSEKRTWRAGLRRLLRGLSDGDAGGIDLVSVTEVDRFDRLLSLIEDLEGDLTPLWDGTQWSISVWVRYFGCLLETYFALDPGHDLYRGFLELASQVGSLEGEVEYRQVERVWQQMVTKRSGGVRPPHLQSVRFGALGEGAVLPSKVICLLGMGEGAFPRREERPAFLGIEESFCPKREEVDRFSLLQAIHSASNVLMMSHSEEAFSLPVQEVLTSVGGEVEVCNERVLSGELEKPPLIPSFYEKRELTLPSGEDAIEVDVQDLIQFGKHPVRFYLQKVLGISLGEMEGEKGFVLSPLLKYMLGKKAAGSSVEEVIAESEEKGELPPGICKPLAIEQIRKEAEAWESLLSDRDLSFSDLKTVFFEKSYHLSDGREVLVRGKLRDVSPKGIVYRGEDPFRTFPQRLFSGELGLTEPCGKMRDYLTYFLMAKENPSPLVPALASAVIAGDVEAVGKGLKSLAFESDDAFAYLLMRDPPPDPKVLISNWSAIGGDVYAAV